MAERIQTKSATLNAIVLAAGTSVRFGKENKLLLPLGKQSVIREVISRVRSAGVEDIVVITGHERAFMEMELSGEEVRMLFNPDFATGMGSSIVRGVGSAESSEGFLIIPGDMPLIAPETINRILSAWTAESAVVPVYRGRRGHPVLFGGCFRRELLAIPFDRGARSVLAGNPGKVTEIEVEDPFIHLDIDSVSDYENALRLFVRPGPVV